MRFLFASSLIYAVSSSVASFLPTTDKRKLLLKALVPLLSQDVTLIDELQDILGNERVPIVLEHFFAESTNEDLDTLASILLDRREFLKATSFIRERLPAFLDTKRGKCMYWSFPKKYRWQYDELIDPSGAEFLTSLPIISTEWVILSEEELLSAVLLSLPVLDCRPLNGPYVSCSKIVIDIVNKCAIKLKSERQTSVVFFPFSRSVFETVSNVVPVSGKPDIFTITEMVTLHKGDSEPESFTITHDEPVDGAPIQTCFTGRAVHEAPLRIVYKPPNRSGMFEIKDLESGAVRYTDVDETEKVKESTVKGFLKERRFYDPRFYFKKTLFNSLPRYILGEGKLVVLYDYRITRRMIKVYSYAEWEKLPMEARFLRYEDIPLPRIYPRQNLVAEVEEVSKVVAHTDHYFEPPRSLPDGESGWLNKADVGVFQDLKLRIDALFQSEYLLLEVAYHWRQNSVMPKVPLHDVLISLNIDLLGFVLLFLSDGDLELFRFYLVREQHPFEKWFKTWRLPDRALTALFNYAGCQQPDTISPGLFRETGKAKSMAELKAILTRESL